MSKRPFTHAAWQQSQELITRLRPRYPTLFPAALADLKPWAVGEAARLRQALATEYGERVSTQVWRGAIHFWFRGNLKRRTAYLKCLTAGAPRYDRHGAVSGAVTETDAAQAAVELAQREAQLAQREAARLRPSGSGVAVAGRSGAKTGGPRPDRGKPSAREGRQRP